mmetsp:Transcript_6444/g.9737  ORF Transcript_6444/g.9737 Transcript_6444/m.9737 type:complete len:198 (+) Transcript_6444:63-656(+)
MNATLLILLLLIIDANVSAASGRVHLRGKRAKSDQIDDPQRRTADTAEDDESICQDVDIDLVGTKWNLTNFTWYGFADGGEETLKPVTPERRGMTLLLEEDGFSGTCGNNLCWGVAEKIGDNMFWIHALARTKMASTLQEEAYAIMLTNSPYTYRTCVDSATNHTKLHLFEVVDTDDDGNPKQGRLMAIYDQIQLLL